MLRPCHTRQLLQATWRQPIAVHATGPLGYAQESYFEHNWSDKNTKTGEHSEEIISENTVVIVRSGVALQDA